MMHQRPKPFIVCPNYDPGLTLTYFSARSNLATWAFLIKQIVVLVLLESLI